MIVWKGNLNKVVVIAECYEHFFFGFTFWNWGIGFILRTDKLDEGE